MVGFGEAVKRAFAGYVTFSGRATRAELWWWVLFVSLVGLIPYALLLASIDTNPDGTGTFSGLWLAVFVLVELALILPGISVTVRRLHDTDRSGWWYWISLVPCIGTIWLLVILVSPGTPGPNKYGSPSTP